MALTVVDAGVLIGFLNVADEHHPSARQTVAAALGRGDSLALPASAFAEALVGPIRRGDDAVAAMREVVEKFAIQVILIDAVIAEAAARLRARHGARLLLPDALVVATAQVLDADVLLTTDRGWPPSSSLELRGELVQI